MLLSSLIRLCHYLGSTGEQSHWLGLLLGSCRKELGLKRSTCWLLQAPPLFCVTIRFPVQSPWGKTGVGVPKKQLAMLGSWMSAVGSLFLTEEPQAQGRPPSVVLCWPGGGQCCHHKATPLTLLMSSVFVSAVQGVLQPLDPRNPVF